MRLLIQYLYRHHPQVMVRVWRRQQGAYRQPPGHTYAGRGHCPQCCALCVRFPDRDDILTQTALIVNAAAARIRAERMPGLDMNGRWPE